MQILAGPPELRIGIFGSMLKLIALTTLVVSPILLLLLLSQIQFLPFHDVTITWAQRTALILDIVLLWLLRPPILADLSVESLGRTRLFSRALRGFGLVVAGVTQGLSGFRRADRRRQGEAAEDQARRGERIRAAKASMEEK